LAKNAFMVFLSLGGHSGGPVRIAQWCGLHVGAFAE
jgi:hypothetical protein